MCATLIAASAIAAAATGLASPTNTEPGEPGDDCYIASSGDRVPYPQRTRPACEPPYVQMAPFRAVNTHTLVAHVTAMAGVAQDVSLAGL
jgi:hypothetical protein